MSWGDTMTAIAAIRHELANRLDLPELDKTHLSIRLEPGSHIARVGACIEPYNWDTREAVIRVISEFEDDHVGDFAVDFDVIPLEAVNDASYAEM